MTKVKVFFKHTPGPWKFKAAFPSKYGQSYDIATDTDDHKWVAYTIANKTAGTSKEEAEANACLIAAAPELLEAAIAFGGMPDGCCFCSSNRSGSKEHHEPECRDLINAIAKATNQKEVSNG